MASPTIIGKEIALFDFMKASGFPIFHRSNMFLRDIEYGIRDFFRATEKIDIGSRQADILGDELIRDLEVKGMLIRQSASQWLLNNEKYLNPPKVEEKKAEPAAA
ncbi:MAG: hypothetical protein IPP94_17200 [Ignavibacteria bacterium]|nr:hypothetical protein [Ignavibacteria bacterium]